jgi:hypothetical protein
MKQNTRTIVIFFSLLSLIILGNCEKDSSSFEELLQPQMENRAESNLENIRYVVESLQENFTSDSRAAAIFVQKENGAIDVIELLTYGSEAGDYPLDDFPVPVVEKIVCQGSNNVKFARCVGEWLAAHPGECLKVWTDGNTNFADDDCDTPG